MYTCKYYYEAENWQRINVWFPQNFSTSFLSVSFLAILSALCACGGGCLVMPCHHAIQCEYFVKKKKKVEIVEKEKDDNDDDGDGVPVSLISVLK